MHSFTLSVLEAAVETEIVRHRIAAKEGNMIKALRHEDRADNLVLDINEAEKEVLYFLTKDDNQYLLLGSAQVLR